MRLRCLLFALLAVSAAAQSSITASTDVAFHPVKVKFTMTLADSPLIGAGKTYPKMRPALAIWNWGEHRAGHQPSAIDHVDLTWPTDELTQTVEHVYAKQGEYVVMVTVVDGKHRLIEQQSAKIVIQSPVEIVTPKAAQ